MSIFLLTFERLVRLMELLVGVLFTAAWIWMIVIAFGDDEKIWGVAMVLFMPAAFFFGITRTERALIPLVMLCGSIALGVMFYEGAVVEQNYKEAVKWHRLAAEQGHAGSINNLGVCYGQGKGLIVNYKEAARLYEQSARKGYALGMMNIAQMYESGVGVEEDKIYAYMWFDLANEAGHSSAKDKREELSEKMTIQELHFAQEISRMMTMIKNSNRE